MRPQDREFRFWAEVASRVEANRFVRQMCDVLPSSEPAVGRSPLPATDGRRSRRQNLPLLERSEKAWKQGHTHNKPGRTFFLQAAKNSRVHALADEVRSLANSGSFQTKVIYDEPLSADLASGRCDDEGVVTTELLRSWTPVADADFYVCGPPPFMACVLTNLRELGVTEDRVRHEFFGPKQNLEVA